jgi:hypothetical protein
VIIKNYSVNSSSLLLPLRIFDKKMSHQQDVVADKIIHSYDAEDGKKFYDVQSIIDTEDASQNHEENSPELVAAEKSLLWKLDFLYVMPCIAILNFLQARNNDKRLTSFSEED